MPKAVNFAGQTFGRLTGVADAGKDKHGKRLWQFRCECGGEITAIGSDVKSGKTQSCRCYADEVRGINARLYAGKIAEAKTKHGASGPNGLPEYHVWKSMRQRCKNPNDKHFADYGGRGINVCRAWDDFKAFYADLGPRPSDNHSIDRIDVDGNYEPGNVRWATATEQRLNQRRMKDGYYA